MHDAWVVFLCRNIYAGEISTGEISFVFSFSGFPRRPCQSLVVSRVHFLVVFRGEFG